MEFFKQRHPIDFMGQRPFATGLSAVLFILSILSLMIQGLHWGLDFTGGTQIQVSFSKMIPQKIVYDRFAQAGFQDVSVINYGTSKEMLISFSPKHVPVHASNMMEKLEKNMPSLEQMNHLFAGLSGEKIQQINYIGPQVGQEMTTKGIMAIIIALLGTMLYIGMRFDFRFAAGAMLALIHDPIIILGIFSYWHLEFNLIALAAVLTVIGYSLNDTIVIFDRVRENFKKKSNQSSPLAVMNDAINQTLSRTIMTSALTLTVVIALLCLGGPLLHGFSLALATGIIVGTYSSIYVAGSFALALGLNREHLFPPTTAIPEISEERRP